MPALPSRRDEHGFTLVEMVVATAILGIVLLIVYGTLDGGIRQAADIDARIRVEAQVRTTVDAFVRDVRQAYTGDPTLNRITSMSGTTITFYSPDRASPYRLRKISYRLTGTRLERSVTSSTNTGSAPWTFGTAGAYVLAIDGVRNSPVLIYRNAADAVTSTPAEVATVEIRLTIDANTTRGPRPLTYGTTVAMRGVT